MYKTRQQFLNENSINSNARNVGVLGVGFFVDSGCHQIQRFRDHIWNQHFHPSDVAIDVLDVDVPLIHAWFEWSRDVPVHAVRMKIGKHSFRSIFIRWSGDSGRTGQLEWLREHHDESLVLFGDAPLDIGAELAVAFKTRFHDG